MGSWTIEIKGKGAHHNTDYPQDANQLAMKFVKELKEAGHIIDEATFTQTGQVDNLKCLD